MLPNTNFDSVKKYTSAAQVQLIAKALETSQEQKHIRQEYEKKQEAERVARERDEKQRIAKEQALVREKILHEKKLINGFLIAIKEEYEKHGLEALKKIFSEAHLTLGKPLGKIYELMPDSEKPTNFYPNKILCNACEEGKIDVVILFGEAGFDLNKKEGLYSPIEIAIKNINYDLIRIFVELGVDLNKKIVLGYNALLMNAPSVLELYHYLATFGARDDIYMSRTHNSYLIAAYDKGKVYFDEYQATLLETLIIHFPQVLQTLILGYLGKTLSIPMREIRIRRAPDHVTPIQGSQFRFLGKSVLKLDEKVNKRIEKLTEEFDYWMKNYHGHYRTDNEELIRWFKTQKNMDDYETFYNIAINLNQKGYITDPPPSEKEFNIQNKSVYK